MTNVKNTIYDLSDGNDWHRVMGRKCYGMDVDMIEFKYTNGKPVPVAVFDFKYPGKAPISDKCFPHDGDILRYNTLATMLNIPFFICITYLHMENPMYVIVPYNRAAMIATESKARWLTPLAYSKFLHHIRKIKWDGNEKINDKCLVSIGLLPGKCLKDLPDVYQEYDLPTIDLDCEQV